ncbi:MAG: L-2-amino-thiazoline-4-carboxylic acid hydrolase [Methanobacterium sp.]
MKTSRLIFELGLRRSKKVIIQRYGKEFYKDFKRLASEAVSQVISQMPDIGNTIFAFNYKFAPTYIACYRASQALGLTPDEIQDMLWHVNERLITMVPKIFMKIFIRSYLNNFRHKAREHERLGQEKLLHPFDWVIQYRNINDTTFEIDIYECGIMKLAAKFDALGILPSVCRVDYMMSNYMGAGFERTKTLGDGDDCCNCRYIIGGNCEWAPDKGFIDRK